MNIFLPLTFRIKLLFILEICLWRVLCKCLLCIQNEINILSSCFPVESNIVLSGPSFNITASLKNLIALCNVLTVQIRLLWSRILLNVVAIIFKCWDHSEEFVEWKVHDMPLLDAGSEHVMCWCDFMVWACGWSGHDTVVT